MSRLTALNYNIPYWTHHNKRRLAEELAVNYDHSRAILAVLADLDKVTGRLV